MFCLVCLAHHVQLVLVIGCFTPVALLNPQSINCLILWIKMTIAWDYSLPYFFSSTVLGPTTSIVVNTWLQGLAFSYFLICYLIYMACSSRISMCLHFPGAGSSETMGHQQNTHFGAEIVDGLIFIIYHLLLVIRYEASSWCELSISLMHLRWMLYLDVVYGSEDV